ncbi:TonB-dependent receptor [Acidovorax sp.]|uniref:TonB-dependent receptor plug domain-containing protein n=1 Tax=Acidovorax sp. TaxID=1872122 RepID=UPI0026266FC8|nr:TonB-dependent receptor [Acidovorax sp.]
MAATTTAMGRGLRPAGGAAPLLLALLVSAGLARAADGTFELGTVTVVGARAEPAPSSEAVLDKAAIERDNRDTVGAAVSLLPGMALSRNSRNEDLVYLRGFDARQVPVFVDGVPLYVPYDGYVDFARFTTFDLAEIRVAKAGASLLYGPNTLGGAINLVTRKPVRAWEGDVRLGLASGSEKKAAVNIGSNQGMWYFQLGASALDADSFPLPKGFKDYKAQPTDTGSQRENAYRTDQRLSFKLGLTPNATDEYALGYVRQEGEKGNPVYTGRSTSGIRYWQWPYWDKDSLYFISSTRLGQNNVLKARVFHDTYKNKLDAFTDGTYAQALNNTSFPSVYNDTSNGVALELANYSLNNHELRVALHVKEDKHQDSNPSSDTKNYRDVTTSLALEDTIALAPNWRLRAGLSHDKRDAKEVYFWPLGATSATNGVLELTHTLDTRGTEVYAVASHKTRFPTIKDRYSARMGRALPNPDLKPEVANHLEAGLKGSPWAGGQGQVAVFYSRITDLMQNAIVAAPVGTCGRGSTTCEQVQNISKARSAGLELSLQQSLGSHWAVGGAYTYLARRNLSDASVRLTDTPRHRLYAALNWTPSDAWEVRASVESEQGRTVPFAGSGRSSYRDLGGFAILGVKATWKPRKDMALDFGVNNLGDKWYELGDGLPMPGRSWFIHGTYRF